MAIEHDFFGLIDEPSSGSAWAETVNVGDQVVDVSLNVQPGRPLLEDGLDIAAAVIGALEGLDIRARGYLVQGIGEAGSDVITFLSVALEELGDEVEDVLVDRSGDLDIDLIRSLVLERVVIYPGETSETEAFAVLTFGIDSELAEQRISVSVTRVAELAAIDVLD